MKKCKYCKGRGIYIVRETYGDGDQIDTAKECNHCHGTGRDQDPDEGPDFDIGGDSYDDDDN